MYPQNCRLHVKAPMFAVLIGLALMTIGCGSDHVATAQRHESLSVSPGQVILQSGSSVRFIAGASDTNKQQLQWLVNGVVGGDEALGTVTELGVYTAPLETASSVAIEVSARMQDDPSVEGSARITVLPSASRVQVFVRPSHLSLQVGQTQKFTAFVTGSRNKSVHWFVNGVQGGTSNVGTISSDGSYTAPEAAGSQSIIVTARSVYDPNSSKNAQINLISSPVNSGNPIAPATISISPNNYTLSGNQFHQFTVLITGHLSDEFYWSVNNVRGGSPTSGTISSTGLFTAPASPVVDTVANITATSQSDLTISASATVTILARNSGSTPDTGTSFFVDGASGNDLNDGRTPAKAWRSIAKVNTITLRPGDKVLFKRGGKWRGQVVVKQSGVDGDPITFGAYGDGARPILDGSETVSNWQTLGGGTYSSKTDAEVLEVYFRNDKLARRQGEAQSIGANGWDQNDGILYVNLGPGPAATSDVEIITTQSKESGFTLWNGNNLPGSGGQKYVTVSGFHLEKYRLAGVLAVNTDHAVVSDSEIDKIGPGSNNGSNDPVAVALNHNTLSAIVEDSSMHDIVDDYWDGGGAGVYIGTAFGGRLYSSRSNIVRRNEIYNLKTGITIKYGSIENLIQDNKIHDVSYTGIVSVGSEKAGNSLIGNEIFNISSNGRSGIEAFNYTTISDNLIYKSYNGILINALTSEYENKMSGGNGNAISGNTLRDNVENLKFLCSSSNHCATNRVTGNVIRDGVRAISISDPAWNSDNNQIDNNCYDASGSLHFYFSPNSLDLAAWKLAIHGDLHSSCQTVSP